MATASSQLRVEELPPPTDDDVGELLHRLVHRIQGLARRELDDDRLDWVDEERQSLLNCTGEDGKVCYTPRRPWPKPGGRTELQLEPPALLRRLAALIPAPYTNLVRYHGVLHNRSKARPLMPSPKLATPDDNTPPRCDRTPSGTG